MEVILIAAMTADGLIAQSVDQVSTAWTSKADRDWFAKVSKEIGVIVMGWNTFMTIGKPLSDRLNIVYSLDPQKSAEQYKFPNLRFTNKKPEELLDELEKDGFGQVAICGGATIYSNFLKQKLINKIYLTIEPVMFGQGLRICKEALGKVNLKLINCQKLENEQTVVLEYEVNR